MSEHPETFLVEQLNEDFGYFVRASRTLVESRTRFQDLALYETPMFGKLLRLDEVFMTSEKDEFFYHENLIHPAAITHPAPRRALVIGGGDGGAAEELCKHAGMEQVVLAELDEGVIAACREHLPTIHRGVFDDPRLELAIGDGRAYVEQEGDPFDLIALDLTDPHGPSQALYTREFYAACRARLSPEGLLSLHVESPISRPNTYARILATLASVFPIVRPYLVYIPLYGTWWGMATASERSDPLHLSEDEVERRIAARGLGHLQFYNGAMHRALFALPNFVRALIARPAEPIHDASPPLSDDIAVNQHRRLKLVPA